LKGRSPPALSLCGLRTALWYFYKVHTTTRERYPTDYRAQRTLSCEQTLTPERTCCDRSHGVRVGHGRWSAGVCIKSVMCKPRFKTSLPPHWASTVSCTLYAFWECAFPSFYLYAGSLPSRWHPSSLLAVATAALIAHARRLLARDGVDGLSSEYGMQRSCAVGTRRMRSVHAVCAWSVRVCMHACMHAWAM